MNRTIFLFFCLLTTISIHAAGSRLDKLSAVEIYHTESPRNWALMADFPDYQELKKLLLKVATDDNQMEPIEDDVSRVHDLRLVLSGSKVEANIYPYVLQVGSEYFRINDNTYSEILDVIDGRLGKRAAPAN